MCLGFRFGLGCRFLRRLRFRRFLRLRSGLRGLFRLAGRLFLRLALGFLARFLRGRERLRRVVGFRIGFLQGALELLAGLLEFLLQAAEPVDFGLVGAEHVRYVFERGEEVHDVLRAEHHFDEAGGARLRLVKLYARRRAALLLLGKAFLKLLDALFVVGDLLAEFLDARNCAVVFGRRALDFLLCGIRLHVRVDVLGQRALRLRRDGARPPECQSCGKRQGDRCVAVGAAVRVRIKFVRKHPSSFGL